jgi:hypothetical protein
MQPLSDGGNVSKKTEMACGFFATIRGVPAMPVAFWTRHRDTSIDALVERGCVHLTPNGAGKCNRPYPLPRHKTHPYYEPSRGPVQPPTKNHNLRLNRHSRPARPGLHDPSHPYLFPAGSRRQRPRISTPRTCDRPLRLRGGSIRQPSTRHKPNKTPPQLLLVLVLVLVLVPHREERVRVPLR